MQTVGAEAVPHAPAPAAAESAQIAQFFIPAAASLQERRPRTLKHDDTFAVFDHNGDALSGAGSPEGIFHRDTRHLSHFFLTIGGARPMLLSSTLGSDNATLTCDLTNPDLFEEGELALEHDVIHLRRSRFLSQASCFERLVVRNFGERSQRISVEIGFGADFADLFEVRGTSRDRRGQTHAPAVGQAEVLLSYTGLDRRRQTTALRFDPAPTRLTGNAATFTLQLAPKEACSLFIAIDCASDTVQKPARSAFFRRLRQVRRTLRASSRRAAAVTSSNEIFNEAIRRSQSDLHTLTTDTPEGPYPYAGIPWFSTVFGRDALITALETLWLDPALARGVLRHLAANQAEKSDAAADVEPGKILHEIRHGEMAMLGEVPFRRYFGSVDSTPLFVMLAAAYLQRTGDLALMRELWPNIEAALAWIGRHGDRDGDGFVEYERRTAAGLINQGWKDSSDSVFHADGTLARGPIALAEVQAYTYGAWRAAAEIAYRLGHANRARVCERRASALQVAFDSAFFDEELGTYALALDGEKRPCRVRSSNAGHALFTGIALPERVPAVVDTLMSAPSFCGWGVRTISASEARYNPMSYHNGSVWPHDNALIAAGFARYGFQRQAAQIFEGIFAASTYIDLRRLPELFCGFTRERRQGPTFYPVACMPQAWAAAAPISMLQSCVGLGFNLEHSDVTFEKPILPAFLHELVFRNLSIGNGTADVALRRSGRQVVVDVLERTGETRVVTRM